MKRGDGAWQAELSTLSVTLHARLRRAFPTRSADHDDIVNTALMRIDESVRASEALAQVPGDQRRAHLEALGWTIARNYMLDLVRKETREWSLKRQQEATADPGGQQGANIEREIDATRVIEVIIEVLAGANSRDREVFARLIGAHALPVAPLTVDERKRAVKLRTRLQKEIERRFGPSALESLRAARSHRTD